MAKIQSETQQAVAQELGKNQLIKFGSFTLKSGVQSPFYLDLREVQSYPSTLRAVVRAFSELLAESDQNILLAGVPEAGTPLATAVGYELGRPLVQPRKVIKEHGTKSSVEGAFEQGDRVILIDDLITRGDSKLEAIKQIEDAGLVVEKFLVLIDREQGGIEAIREAGYQIEAAMTISSLADSLLTEHMLEQQQYDEVMSFVKGN